MRRKKGVEELSQRFYKPARYNIAKLVGKLRRRSPIRLWLESYGEIVEGSATTLFQALALTEPDAWADRAVAFHVLRLIELSPSERENARRILLDALKKPDVERLSLERFCTAVGIAFVGWLILAIVFSMPVVALPVVGFLSFLTSPFLLALQELNRAAITRQIAATALAQSGDPECVVVLCEHVRRRTGIFTEAEATLKAVLPRITSDWYGRLPSGCNGALVSLALSPDWDLALLALDALGRAGDGSSAEAIAQITVRKYPVFMRATAVLPTLVARQEREKASAVLLRPSAKNQTDHLVRPAYDTNPDVTNLLRASHAESTDAPSNNVDH
jgi:hypothetical protein